MQDRIHVLCEILEGAAKQHKKNYGEMPVLIIDGSDILAKRHQTVLEDLLHCAKVFADNRIMTISFVTSDGSAIGVLKQLPSCAAILRYAILRVKEIFEVVWLATERW